MAKKLSMPIRRACKNLLTVDDLVVEFSVRRRWRTLHRESVRAVDRVSFDIGAGEIFGLVGESGSGKTTVARSVVRLYEPTGGTITFEDCDITHARERTLRKIRPRFQMVFQDPYASVNPKKTVEAIVATPMHVHKLCRGPRLKARVRDLLADVDLPPDVADCYPHELSGGQLQRVAIARALGLNPALLIADEAVSKLDVSVRAQILNLLKKVQRDRKLGMLFITHDLSVARYMCDTIGVMYRGKLVETGDATQIFNHPSDEYTQRLLDAALLSELAPKKTSAESQRCPADLG